jgi:FAD/FMN-containing dehydrogenase
MKLLIGSYGTLGVITSASFKLFPAPGQTRTFIAEFATWQEALKFGDMIVRSPLSPMCLELVSPGARKIMQPEETDDAWVICVRGAGSDAVLARYRKELGSPVVRELDGGKECELWRIVENFPYESADEAYLNVVVPAMRPVNIMAPPSELARIVEVFDDVHRPQQSGVRGGFIGRIGIGHLRVHAFPMPDAFWEGPGKFVANRLTKFALNAVIVATAGKHFPSEARNKAALSSVKQALDANNILQGRDIA